MSSTHDCVANEGFLHHFAGGRMCVALLSGRGGDEVTAAEYVYHHAGSTGSDAYLWPALANLVEPMRRQGVDRAFDLGCGNGRIAGLLEGVGFHVTGVDISESGVTVAANAHPRCRLEVGSVYDDLVNKYGQFPLVISLEVVEHLFDPRRFARTLFDLVEPGGTAIVSTPYHGYWKNLALAVSGKLDSHFTALCDGGHIKFFSIVTLRKLLVEAGFVEVRLLRVGRVPVLAKSMIAIGRCV